MTAYVLSRPRLRKLMLISLVVYTLVLSLIVALHGHLVNERVEALIWESMLKSEIAYIKQRVAGDPKTDWFNVDVFHWYSKSQPASIPVEFQGLPAGIHDEIRVGNKQFVILVESATEGGNILALDITDIEEKEFWTTVTMIVSTVLIVALMALCLFYGVDRLLRPLTKMADDIANLHPEGENQNIQVDKKGAHETYIIAEAINGFTQRIRTYIDRERNFINMASHELRTPIAAISGAIEVTIDHADTTPAIRSHMLRAKHIVQHMADLATVLLTLARDPDKLLKHTEEVNVQQALPAIVKDHEYLCAGKALSISIEVNTPLLIIAPPQIVLVAISNLLRNAIENCDSGIIRIYSQSPGSITIDDPGQGMTVTEMSKIYTRMAKSGRVGGGGIGIELIARICTHLGWRLDFESVVGRGTKAILFFNPAA